MNTRPRGLLALLLTVALPAHAGRPRPSEPNWTLGGVPTQLIEVPAAAPIGDTPCPGVRPGAIVQSDVGQCTFNFVFAGSDGRSYIGTAGHCILDGGETSWAPGEGPVARDASDARIGEFAYAILQDPKDFALIRVDPDVTVSPQMCHFGGPTGINADTPAEPVVLHHYGNGIGVGSVVPARTALADGMPDRDHVFAQGAVVPGDSGSGIISDDGRAVGVIVTVGIHYSDAGDAGVMGITRLAPQLARAEDVLGVGLPLRTAPTL